MNIVKADELSKSLAEQALCVIWSEWPEGAPRPVLHTAQVAEYSDEARRGEYQITPKATSRPPAACSSCGAQILWVKTEKRGANMPLSLRTIRKDSQGRVFALSHWTDCPSAGQHRRKKEAKANDATG